MDKFVLRRHIGTDKPQNTNESNKSADSQPTTLKSVVLRNTKSTRHFLPSWVEKFSWLIYDSEEEVALCNVCKTVYEKGILTFSSKMENVFIKAGFANWKKAIEKFRIHEMSACHKEAVLKFISLEKNINRIFEKYQRSSKYFERKITTNEGKSCLFVENNIIVTLPRRPRHCNSRPYR